MPTGEEHADECTLWLLGIKRERTSARLPSPRAREEAMEASDSFFQKEETSGEDAWTVLFRRKKRAEKVPGRFYPKGRNGRRGCLGRFFQKEETREEDAWTTPPKSLDYPTKRIERDGGLRLRDFSKEAEASERRTQRLLPSLSGASPKQVPLEKQGAAQDIAARCIGPRRALRRASHRGAFNLFHFSLT